MSNYILEIQRFKELVSAIQQPGQLPDAKRKHINQLLTLRGLNLHYTCGSPKRVVVGEFEVFEHAHERQAACKLADQGYDLVFVPNSYFDRDEKKFDVFFCRDHIFLPADFKSLTTKNPDTIGKRIKSGENQASCIILDILSDISVKDLINGLKLGSERNVTLIQIILFYRSRCYLLKKDQILSKNGLRKVLK